MSQRMKTQIWDISASVSGSTTHDYRLIFSELFDVSIACGDDCFQIGVRLRETSDIICVV